MTFTVIDVRSNEPVAAIKRHSETYATFLEGSDEVFKILEAKIPVTQAMLVEVLHAHGYRLEAGLPSWVDGRQWGRRFIPKFWCDPDFDGWQLEYELEDEEDEPA